MNWIKSNPFVAGLAGITILVCGVLYFFGSKGSSSYEAAKEEFDQAYQLVTTSERIPLYPKAETRAAKNKALVDYRESIGELRELFAKYRVEKIDNISTQAFTEQLKAANEEVTQALSAAGCEIPEGFFMGFENYRDQLARSEATGLLDYQLEGVKHALLDLAEARPSQLIQVYRERIPEETGGKPEVGPNAVSRKFGFEVAFKGSEASARKFISSLGDAEPYYYVVRCIKIDNERDIPPRVADAKFETPRAALEEPEVANPFGSFFPEEEEPAREGDAPVEGEPEAVIEMPVVPVDSSRILAQVLGGEEALVFVRFDLTMFLPVKELPKP